MNHERFVQLARETAFNDRGSLRRLAPHVRRLYAAIREVQEDENAFAYIAEVIQEARGDKTDAEAFMHRIKTYYHRDRKALGDDLVVRGYRRLLELRTKTKAAPGARLPSTTNELKEEAISSSRHGAGELEHSAPLARSHHANAASATRGQTVVPEDRRSLTAALNRRGHRRNAPGG